MTDNKIIETWKKIQDILKKTENVVLQKEPIDDLVRHITNILDLINRQKAEIERLKSLMPEKRCDNCIHEEKSLQASPCCECFNYRNFAPKNFLKLIEAEAYKEFAENAVERVEKAKLKYQRLCKEQGEEMEEVMHIHFNGIIEIINNLLKEMERDNDE